MTTAPRRNPSQWQTLIEQQIDSGLTATEFCKQRELSFNYFCKRKRAFQKSSESVHHLNGFIKLQPKPQPLPVSETGLVIHYGETRLHLSTEMNPKWIAQLLKSLS